MEKEKSWRPDNWENPEKGKTNLHYGRDIIVTEKIFEAGADTIHKAGVEWLEKNVFYIDTRGFTALKPHATENWLTFIGRLGEESEVKDV